MLSEFVRTADWKSEKHVPAITCAETVSAGEALDVTVTVGKEIAHPNTLGHHIAWIALHFVPAGTQRSIEIGRCEFSAHGSAAENDANAVYTDSTISLRVRLATAGTLYATAYCNLHGLWMSEKTVAVS